MKIVKRTYVEDGKDGVITKGLIYRTYNNDFEKRKKMINSLEKVFRNEEEKNESTVRESDKCKE